MTSVTWSQDNGYIKNSKLGLLHRYMMKKWYGQDVLAEMTKGGWVVDHMNNNGCDCRICNLEFLSSRYNLAKGQTLDVESAEMKFRIALNMFKDFSTGLYQISIGFNDNVYFWNQYIEEQRLVINDAEKNLLEYQTQKKIVLNNYILYRGSITGYYQLIIRKVGDLLHKDRLGLYYLCEIDF